MPSSKWPALSSLTSKFSRRRKMKWIVIAHLLWTLAAFGRYCQFCGTNNLPSLYSNPEPLAVLGADARTFLVSPTYPPVMTAELQDASNLVAIWKTRTKGEGQGPYCLTLTDDGYLTIWDSDCYWTWRNGQKPMERKLNAMLVNVSIASP
ncbi:hypothetical protein AC1031_021913 [Aphanomyces cochlioides]|nr:hypothetical protein AC1031_021913 [Aphanomyces cochlioides]